MRIVVSLVEQGVRPVLAGLGRSPERRRVEIPVCRQGGGILPGVDPDDSAALLDRMEGRPAS